MLTNTKPVYHNNRVPSDSLGGRIRQKRIEMNWHACDFAKKVGIGIDTLSHLENNHYDPRLLTLMSIADALGVSLDWLVYGRGDGSIDRK